MDPVRASPCEAVRASDTYISRLPSPGAAIPARAPAVPEAEAMSRYRPVERLPDAITHAPIIWPVVDPVGYCVIPADLLECPSCHTMKAFFLVEQLRGGYRCLGCARNP